MRVVTTETGWPAPYELRLVVVAMETSAGVHGCGGAVAVADVLLAAANADRATGRVVAGATGGGRVVVGTVLVEGGTEGGVGAATNGLMPTDGLPDRAEEWVAAGVATLYARNPTAATKKTMRATAAGAELSQGPPMPGLSTSAPPAVDPDPAWSDSSSP